MKIKRVLLLVLSIVMCFVLVGCKDKSATTKTTSKVTHNYSANELNKLNDFTEVSV